jgi:hypothetical protein
LRCFAESSRSVERQHVLVGESAGEGFANLVTGESNAAALLFDLGTVDVR